MSYVLTFIVSVLTAIVLRRLQPKAKLHFWWPHQFAFDVRSNEPAQPPLLVFTRSIRLDNVGREAATNVEVVHNSRPQNFKIWPPMDWSEATNPEGFHFIKLPRLNPREGVSIELLSAQQLPELSAARCDQGEATFRPRQWTPILPLWFNFTAAGLALVGFVVITFKLVQWTLRLAGIQ